MFTGIVEETGYLRHMKKGGASAQLVIEGQCVLEDLKLGDSVAVNGVCLTATQIEGRCFQVDVMHETLSRSNLGELAPGDKVNLERAMAANGRFGGHIVSGHIDGTGTIVEKRRDANAIWYTIRTNPAVMGYIVEKGSIAIDGISLTVAALEGERFKVSVIPHTLEHTILAQKGNGDTVNLENDIIGKYVERFLTKKENTASKESTLTKDALMQAGFIG